MAVKLTTIPKGNNIHFSPSTLRGLKISSKDFFFALQFEPVEKE